MAIKVAGEHPKALDAAGISVKRVTYMPVLASGFIAGIEGGTLILSGLNIFFDNVTAGKGFIAFAAIVFGKWVTLPTVLAML